jgi:O-antigen/teichoic acid export membrane protein
MKPGACAISTAAVTPGIFDPSEVRTGLREKTVRSASLTVTTQLLRTGYDLGVAMVMARWLSPAEYGLVAMVYPLTGLMGMFKDLGLSAATVQKEDIRDEQVSFMFWVNVVLAVFLSLVIAAASPWVGRFYGDNRTTGILLALTMTLVLGGLTTQHQAILQRRMKFGQMAGIDLGTTVLRGATGMVTAILGWSYWSLVAMAISGTLINCIAVWIVAGWRPSRPRIPAGMRDIFHFGGGLTVSRLCWFLSGNVDKLLIGKTLGAASLGVYNRAFQLLLIPIDQLFTPVSQVIISALSRLGGDPGALRRGVREIGELMMLAITPAMAIIYVLAPEIVRIVLGPAWNEAVPIFRGLALSALVLPVNYLCGAVLQSAGRTDALMRWAPVTMVISIVSIAIGLRWGAAGVAHAWAVGVLVFRGPGFYYTVSRHTAVTFMDLASPIIRYSVPFLIILLSGAGLKTIFPIGQPFVACAVYGLVLSGVYGLFLLGSGKAPLLVSLGRMVFPHTGRTGAHA